MQFIYECSSLLKVLHYAFDTIYMNANESGEPYGLYNSTRQRHDTWNFL